MSGSHWVDYHTKEIFEPNLNKFGFVYLITNKKNKKGYVGCKQYFIGKAKKESKWQTYMGSSKYLKADIKKIGKEHFTFEVIAEYKNRRSLRYYEAYYQMKWNVLTAVIEGSDEPAFYNSYVGGKWYRPVESYTDPEYIKNLTESVKFRTKPMKCTKENGEVVIFKKCREAEEAGYDHRTLSHMANGGYQKQKYIKRGYTVRKKHKDIVKAEYLINDQEE